MYFRISTHTSSKFLVLANAMMLIFIFPGFVTSQMPSRDPRTVVEYLVIILLVVQIDFGLISSLVSLVVYDYNEQFVNI